MFQLHDHFHVPGEVVLVVHAAVELFQPFFVSKVALLTETIPLVVPMEELDIVLAVGHDFCPLRSECPVVGEIGVVTLQKVHNLVVIPLVSDHKGLAGLLPLRWE